MRDMTTLSPQPELEPQLAQKEAPSPLLVTAGVGRMATLCKLSVPSCCLPLSCSGYHVLLACAAGSAEIWTDPAPLGLPELRDGGWGVTEALTGHMD